MKKTSVIILSAVTLSLLLSACAAPDEQPSDTLSSPADIISATDMLIENITLQPEPITEAPTEPVTDSPAEPIVLCQNERYTVIAFEGNAYVNFVEGNEPTYDAIGHIPELGFTFKELAEGLYYQTLTEDQIARVKSLQPREELGIWLTELVVRHWPDKDAVKGQLSATTGQQRLTYPSDLSDGGSYDPEKQFTVQLSGGIIEFGHISQSLVSASYETLKNRDFKDYEDRDVTVTREESGTYLGYPCQIVEYHGETESYRDIYITFADDSRSIEVEISYCLEDTANTGLRPVSDSAPWRVLIFGQENGTYFYAYLYHFTEAPAIAWLSSFGYDWVPDSADHVAS